MELEIGAVLGDYQVVGTLGAGGMGQVYKVRNTISDRVEAMKVLLPDLAAMPDLADRFLREIKVLASLDNPNIAQLHTAVRAENQLLMVMEFVNGETLEHKLKAGPLPITEAMSYIGQVLLALEFAHAHGVVHRDIKPANMMLTPAGTIKLMDFGIAKAAADQKLTMTGTTMGSVYYMSPEQIQGAATLDARADLYSVGVTLYELVTGKRPFDGGSQYAIMAAHLEKTPVPPIALDPKLPQTLNDVILMSVAKDPGERFQSAAAFRNALLGVASMLQAPTEPVVAPPPVAAAPAQAIAAERSGSTRWLWMTVGGLATVAAIMCVIEFAPWKATHAAAPVHAVMQQEQTAPPPAEQVPPPSTPPADAAAPAAVAPPVAETPAPTTPKIPESKPAEVAASKPPLSVSAAPAPHQQVQPHTQAVAAPAAAPSGPSLAEVQHAHDHIAKLQVRAGSIRDSIGNLKSSLQAQGLSLNAKFTQPEGSMETYLRSADEAMSRLDLPAAREYADKAEHQIEILEKLLNL